MNLEEFFDADKDYLIQENINKIFMITCHVDDIKLLIYYIENFIMFFGGVIRNDSYCFQPIYNKNTIFIIVEVIKGHHSLL